MADRRVETGRVGEQAAHDYLAASGYEIMARNWRCRSGELDLVAGRGELIAVVEVRTRRAGGRFGTAAESVDVRKQLKVRATAQVYLKQTGAADKKIRFDVIAVTLDREGAVTEMRHYEGAF